jgi:hypothetical protein
MPEIAPWLPSMSKARKNGPAKSAAASTVAHERVAVAWRTVAQAVSAPMRIRKIRKAVCVSVACRPSSSLTCAATASKPIC